LIVSLEPAITAVMAYVFFGELLNGIQIFGSLMILTAVVFFRIYEGKLLRLSTSEEELALAES
jgi:drug/metabolite transporter (DMT)-like permease